VIYDDQLHYTTAPDAKIKDSRAVYDAAWSREMDPDVPSMRDTGRCEVEACRMDTVNPPNKLICSR
jgi:hypothetical protein